MHHSFFLILWFIFMVSFFNAYINKRETVFFFFAARSPRRVFIRNYVKETTSFLVVKATGPEISRPRRAKTLHRAFTAENFSARWRGEKKFSTHKNGHIHHKKLCQKIDMHMHIYVKTRTRARHRNHNFRCPVDCNGVSRLFQLQRDLSVAVACFGHEEMEEL